MSQLVKTKRQTNFKDFKRFGALKWLVEQKIVIYYASGLNECPASIIQLFIQVYTNKPLQFECNFFQIKS
jgi:hypothetical protein